MVEFAIGSEGRICFYYQGFSVLCIFWIRLAHGPLHLWIISSPFIEAKARWETCGGKQCVVARGKVNRSHLMQTSIAYNSTMRVFIRRIKIQRFVSIPSSGKFLFNFDSLIFLYIIQFILFIIEWVKLILFLEIFCINSINIFLYVNCVLSSISRCSFKVSREYMNLSKDNFLSNTNLF